MLQYCNFWAVLWRCDCQLKVGVTIGFLILWWHLPLRNQTLEQVKGPKMRCTETLNYVYGCFKFVGTILCALHIPVCSFRRQYFHLYFNHTLKLKLCVTACMLASYLESGKRITRAQELEASLSSIATLSLRGGDQNRVKVQVRVSSVHSTFYLKQFRCSF